MHFCAAAAMYIRVIFFFSSRRRHTRFDCDWSSDVCSSDLNVGDFRWGTLAESSLQDWQSIFTSNLLTVLYMSRAALPHMRRARWGRIINMGDRKSVV